MADTGSIPFADAVDYVRNKGDDEFESSFDETYGDPNHNGLEDGTLRSGFTLIVLAAAFLFFLVVLRYGCFWFIDYVIMCDHRQNPRNHRGFFRHNLSKCCPCWFPSSVPDVDPLDNQGRSNGNDGSTAANTSNHSDSSSDSSEDGRMEMVERNRSYARRLVRILSEEQKRSIFASILNGRTATSADISEKRREEDFRSQQNASLSESEDSTTSFNESSIVVPDGSPLPTNIDEIENNHACCPICIQDIKVGDKVYHCNHCHHLFHFDCILEWVGTGSTLCPYCRREIFTRRMLEQAYQKHQSKKQSQGGV